MPCGARMAPAKADSFSTIPVPAPGHPPPRLGHPARPRARRDIPTLIEESVERSALCPNQHRPRMGPSRQSRVVGFVWRVPDGGIIRGRASTGQRTSPQVRSPPRDLPV